MTTPVPAEREIVPRANLDFGLQGDEIPRYWFGGDAFRTRFFDALSTLFPQGERFFIESVRKFRDQVTDEDLQTEVKHFIFQEAQHTRVHNDFNDRLKRQGMAVDHIEKQQRDVLAWTCRKFPRWSLAQTAAAEHITALMSHFFLGNRDVFQEADPRIRAIYFWHGIEEIEHKAVAFDVMQRVAGVGYFMRCMAMLYVSFFFPLHTFMIMRHMLKVDGLSRGQRFRAWMKGLWWLYGPRGVFTRMLPHYLAYYLPGYHPWKHGETRSFSQWREAYSRHDGDPISATNTFVAAT